MPTLYDAALLTQYVYKYTKENPPVPWQRIKLSYNDALPITETLGYLGVMLINPITNELVIVHRGVKFKEPEYSRSLITPLNNMQSAAQVYYRAVPNETELALQFSTQIPPEYTRFKLTHLGHSLGGAHAHICGYAAQSKVIAFDPPGSIEQLKILFTDIQYDVLRANHFSFFINRNAINTVSSHPGKLYIHSPNRDTNHDAYNTKSVVYETYTTHSIKHFIAIIPQDAADPENGISPIFAELNVQEDPNNIRDPAGRIMLANIPMGPTTSRKYDIQ